LQDVLPIDEPLLAVTIRNHVLKLAQRLEDSMGEEQGCSIEDADCQRVARHDACGGGAPAPRRGGEAVGTPQVVSVAWQCVSSLKVLRVVEFDLEGAVCGNGDATAVDSAGSASLAPDSHGGVE
jgi:hypothetical protein